MTSGDKRMTIRGARRWAIALLLPIALRGASVVKPEDPPLTGYIHTKWTHKDGLPASNILRIAQTPDGYLWLETNSGLVRFDGVRFKIFTSLPGVANTGGAGLCVAADGSIWFGLVNGGVGNLKDGKLTFYPPGNGLVRNQVRTLIQDRSGAIWAGTLNGASRFQNGKWRTFDANDGLPPARVESMYQDSSGTLWVNSGFGLFELPPGQDRFIEHPELRGHVAAVTGDSQGTAWIAAESGIRPARGGRAFPFWQDIVQLHPDRRSNLWMGSLSAGLRVVRSIDSPSSSEYRERFTVKDGLANDTVKAFFEDREGNIWVGTGNGLDCFRVSNFRSEASDVVIHSIAARGNDIFIVQGPSLIRRSGNATAVVPVPGGRLAFAVPGAEPDPVLIPSSRENMELRAAGLLPRSNPAHVIEGVDTFARDPGGGYWYANEKAGLYRWKDGVLRRVPGLEDVFSTKVAADPAGRIWTSDAEGVWCLSEHGWHHYTEAEVGFQGRISAFYIGRDGALWATGTYVSRWKDGHFTAFARNLNHGGDIIEDDQGYTWVASSTGLYRILSSEFDKAVKDRNYQIKFRFFDESDGLSSPPPAAEGSWCARTPDGRLWFALRGGMVSIDPRHVIENRVPPPVIVESATADDHSVAATTGARLPARTRSLHIEYTALSFAAPEKVRFKTKLEGFDTSWVDAGARRDVTYTNLDPKKYHFRVTACNNDGVWNEAGATWEFSVLPAFYQTYWFVALCIVAAASMLWTLYRLRMRSATYGIQSRYEGRLAERTRIARELHDTLLQSLAGASLQLDAISKTMIAAPYEAQTKVQTIRQQMDASFREARQKVWDLRSPALEGRDLASAMRESLEAMIDGMEGFRLTVIGEPRAFPPHMEEQLLRIGQESVANAVRHAQASRITVELRYEAERLALYISDNGQGFDMEAVSRRNGHWGLTNMRERAKEIGAEWKVVSTPGRGTTIETVVPSLSNGKNS